MSEQIISLGAGSVGFDDSSNVLDERLRSRKSPTEDCADLENSTRTIDRVRGMRIKFSVFYCNAGKNLILCMKTQDQLVLY